MVHVSSRFYLIAASAGLAIATLLSYTVLGRLLTPILKVLLAATSILLVISTTIYIFVKISSIREAESRFSKFSTSILFLLFVLYVLSLIIESQLYGGRSFLSSLFLALGMCLAYVNAFVLSRGKTSISIAIVFSLIATFLTWTYFLFPPSLGNDTWRDIIRATETLKSGHIPPQTHMAYPIPIVSLTYSLLSLVTNIDIKWATAFIGLEYLLIILLSTLLLSRRFIKPKSTAPGNTFSNAYLLALLIAVNPLIVAWSLEPISQAYAIIFALSILLLISFQKYSQSAYIAATLLSVAMVLSHGGVTLWFIAFLSFWLLFSFSSEKQGDDAPRLTGKVLRTVVVITLVYWVYTTVMEILVSASQNTWSLLFDLITGTVSRVEGIAAPSPWYNVVLSYSVSYITPVFALIGWCVCREVSCMRKDLADTIFLVGVTSLALGFVGNALNPALTLDRYVGLPAIVILTVLANLGLHAMYTRGRLGKIFVSLIIATLVFGIVFGGLYTPERTSLYAKRKCTRFMQHGVLVML